MQWQAENYRTQRQTMAVRLELFDPAAHDIHMECAECYG